MNALIADMNLWTGMTLIEWEDHYSCVNRSKIVRKIYELRERYEKDDNEKKVWSERDLTYLQIAVLEDLLR